MTRIKKRVAIFILSVVMAFGLFGAMPTMVYATVPTISGLQMDSFDSTSGTYTFSLDVDGNVYALLLPAVGAGPSASVIATTGTSLGLLTATDSPFFETVTGLTPGQDYIVWMTTEDPADPGVYSTPVSVSFTTAICVINNTDYYASLADALTAAGTGDTITLLADISEATPINISGTDLTIDLAGYNLDLLSNDITVDSNGSLTIESDGISGGAVTVNNMIYVEASTLTVSANIKSYRYGIEALDGSTVVANGNIDATGAGVYAGYSSAITVNGNITSEEDQGAIADHGSTLEVTGDINAVICGMNAIDEGTTATMIGNITAVDNGIVASGGSEIILNGNITCDAGTNDLGYANGGICMTAGGTGAGSTVIVNGDISVTGVNACGVNAWWGINVAHINGKITVTGTGSVGAMADGSGQVIVEGAIDPDNYVGFWDYSVGGGWVTVFLTQEQNDATSLKPGYLQYSWTVTDYSDPYTSYIWVRGSDSPTPTPTPEPAIPQTGDTHSWTDLALILVLAALGATGIVLARRRTHKASNTQA